jgi:quercetin dioxygenase-like cupin family protein
MFGYINAPDEMYDLAESALATLRATSERSGGSRRANSSSFAITFSRRNTMHKHFVKSSMVTFAIAAAFLMAAPSRANAQTPGAQRKILHQEDLSVAPGYEAVQAVGIIPPGGREGKHTHPGLMLGYVVEGDLTMETEDKPTVTYKTGESFIVEAGAVHEGVNNGKVPYKAVVTYIVPKGKPLTAQVK